MAHPKTYVDGILLNWGDRLFYEPLRRVKPTRASRVAWPGTATDLRAQVARTIAKVPEVMVKITNRPGGRNGMSAIRSHLQYISRNGDVELEDQDGNVTSGWHDVRDLSDEWGRSGRGIPDESKRREAFNVMLSMPPGTDRAAVRSAARAFAGAEFANHGYVFAAHDDEAHPHVHLCVQARGRNGRRLNPRKADLQRWRERFAEELRSHGVDANATPRRTRGATRRNEPQPAVHMRERGVERSQRQPVELPPDVALAAHMPSLEAWRAMGQAMASSAVSADRRMSVAITDFVRDMPVVQAVPQRDRALVVKPSEAVAPATSAIAATPSADVRDRRSRNKSKQKRSDTPDVER